MTRLHLAALVAVCAAWALAVFAGVEIPVRFGRILAYDA